MKKNRHFPQKLVEPYFLFVRNCSLISRKKYTSFLEDFKEVNAIIFVFFLYFRRVFRNFVSGLKFLQKL